MNEAKSAVGVAAADGADGPRAPIAAVVLVIALLVWLAPFSLGTSMPVGGDVTQFFLGLMGVLSTSLKELRLPVWNDLWGYGFPGVGESQMGVFYPPHLILYGLLSLERAYVASLVLHTLWAGAGAYWASRTFGADRIGACLAGFAYAASGFFVIHMPHPWGYTTGSWLPWAWGLAWSALTRPEGNSARRLLLLAGVLPVQMLPGHFQIAFMTQATVAAMAGWMLLEGRSRSAFGRFVLVAIGLVAALPLAAAQLWPTARLAAMAGDRRDFEYLSGFAATPFHLVSLVAPRLFHGSPLWRPLVWDPFHTSPEEYLAYIGIVPLFLAMLAVVREGRCDAAVRCLAVLGILSLILGLGPYAPGFEWLIRLPGFSFFRAPARWGLPMSLALAILAGLAAGRWRTWERPARGLVAMSIAAVAWIAVVVGLVEGAVWSTSPAGSRGVADLYQRALAILPWQGDPDFRSVASLARRPAVDPFIPPALERLSVRRNEDPRDARSFEQRRFEIYRDELWVPLTLLAAVATTAVVPRLRGFAPLLLVGLTFADLLIFGTSRYVGVGPLKPLAEQSPVLARLTQEPRGTRTIDPLRNLPMAAGLAPVQAYRTLDLPVLTNLSALAQQPLDGGPGGELALQAMRAVGANVRIVSPIEVAAAKLGGVSPHGEVETIADPELARWIYGPDWGPGAPVDFQVVRTPDAPRAWAVPSADRSRAGADPRPILALLGGSRPLEATQVSPTSWEIALDDFAGGSVLVSILHDPQWEATVVDSQGKVLTSPGVRRALQVGPWDGGWMEIDLGRSSSPPGSLIRLSYNARDVAYGLAVSSACWLAWLAAIIRAWRRGCRADVPAAG